MSSVKVRGVVIESRRLIQSVGMILWGSSVSLFSKFLVIWVTSVQLKNCFCWFILSWFQPVISILNNKWKNQYYPNQGAKRLDVGFFLASSRNFKLTKGHDIYLSIYNSYFENFTIKLFFSLKLYFYISIMIKFFINSKL